MAMWTEPLRRSEPASAVAVVGPLGRRLAVAVAVVVVEVADTLLSPLPAVAEGTTAVLDRLGNAWWWMLAMHFGPRPSILQSHLQH